MNNTLLSKSGLGLTSDNISDILSGMVIQVKLSQGSVKGEISVTPIVKLNEEVPEALKLGKKLADMTDEEKRAVEVYDAKIKTSIFAIKDVKNLNTLKNIAQQNRRELEALKIGKTDFITPENLKKFKDYVEKNNQKSKILMQQIVANWDNDIEDTISLVQDKYPKVNPEFIEKYLRKKIGTREQALNSFYCNIKTTSLPSKAGNVNILDPELRKDLDDGANKEAEEQILKAIGETFNQMFQALNLLLKSSTIAPKTKGTFLNAVNALNDLNFLKIQEIDELVEDIKDLAKKSDSDILDIAGDKMYSIYAFLKKYDLEEALKDKEKWEIPVESFELEYENSLVI